MKQKGHVVQSVVSLNMMLVKGSLNISHKINCCDFFFFFQKNCEELLPCKSYSHFFLAKKWHCF